VLLRGAAIRDVFSKSSSFGESISSSVRTALKATTPSEIDTAFATMVQNRIGALVVASDSFLFNRREQIMALAARHRLPAIYGSYGSRQMAGGGGS
jgi:hypothetical protein